jgi:hypothetical protein
MRAAFPTQSPHKETDWNVLARCTCVCVKTFTPCQAVGMAIFAPTRPFQALFGLNVETLPSHKFQVRPKECPASQPCNGVTLCTKGQKKLRQGPRGRRIVCTTTGNLSDRFIKRPRQTSMYYRYGPWRGHESPPRKGPNSGLTDEQKQKVSTAGPSVNTHHGTPFQAPTTVGREVPAGPQ